MRARRRARPASVSSNVDRTRDGVRKAPAGISVFGGFRDAARRMSQQRSPLLPMFLIVLVDVLGFTIVIPLLAYYAEHFGASPLVATTLVSVYAVCSLI